MTRSRGKASHFWRSSCPLCSKHWKTSIMPFIHLYFPSIKKHIKFYYKKLKKGFAVLGCWNKTTSNFQFKFSRIAWNGQSESFVGLAQACSFKNRTWLCLFVWIWIRAKNFCFMCFHLNLWKQLVVRTYACMHRWTMYFQRHLCIKTKLVQIFSSSFDAFL